MLSTQKRLFCYTRLPFGFHGASAIFKSAIEIIIQGLPYVIAYLDDIFVTVYDHKKYLVGLRSLITRLNFSEFV